MELNRMKMQTRDGVADNISWIAEKFPNCITEKIEAATGEVKLAVDFDMLRQELSCEVVDGKEERYQFVWPDKKKAILLANAPINATLRPCEEESEDFANTQNLYIEGDNLDVLKCLKETYLGKVKMIYIDPPYNTGNDFVYNDDFAESLEDYLANSGQYDELGNRLVANTESNGRFHTDWLNMMYPRLKVAKDLLSKDGIIFISIGEEELSNTLKLCDEIFGENNYISTVSRVAKTASNMGNFFAASVDYIICYAKQISNTKPFKGDVDESLYKKIEEDGPRKGEKYRDDVAFFQSGLKHGGSRYPIECPDGELVNTPDNKPWRASEETFLKWKSEGMIIFKETKTSPLLDEMTGEKAHWNLYTKSYLKDRQDKGTQPRNILTDYINRKGADLLKAYGIPFDFAKPVELMSFLCKIINDKDALILDFFSGSATTAHGIMQLNAEDGGNRKYIMVQVPEITYEAEKEKYKDENGIEKERFIIDPETKLPKVKKKTDAYKAGFPTICEIGKERIRRVAKKIKDETGANIDYGFRVLKLDSTNMEDVFYTPAEVNQEQLSLFADNVKPNRTGEDLLFQSMLDLGATLDSKIEKIDVNGKVVYNVADGYLVACFDKEVSDDVVKAIAQMQPQYAVLRDSSLADDSTATNFEQIFKTFSPTTICKIL